MAIKIVLIDDHALFREGLHSLLSQQDQIEVVGTASSGEEGLALCQQRQPDLLLLDLNMPHLSGIQTLQQVFAWRPTMPVIILTLSEDTDDLRTCLSLGAQGYVLKNAEIDFLMQAIVQAVQGNKVMSQEMTNKLLTTMQRGEEPVACMDISSLSQREQEVLSLIAKGYSNKLIAIHMDLAENTIKVHVQSILKKLQLRSRVQAAIFASQYYQAMNH